jgi:hypothetical protein
VSDPAQLPYGGAGDSRAGDVSLADRFRRHSDSLRRSHRSPLYEELMRAAAEDIDRSGVVAQLFETVPTPAGSVPQLRLMAALHYLVLSGRAPALAAFYPSAGGREPVRAVWPVARATLLEHLDWLRARVTHTVQTNEPGRSAVLFPALLWLAHHHRRPIRLLEIGASAGLNLQVDRYCYVVGEHRLGDPGSPLRFVEPWARPPPIDLGAAAQALRIVQRAGCDLAPLDPSRPDDQLTLLSYIWPDELDRLERLRAALSVAVRDPVRIAAQRASEWLEQMLGPDDEGELTVVWHSVMRQYVEPEEWAAIERVLLEHPAVVRLSMEPSFDDHLGLQRLAFRAHPHDPEIVLARAGDHGLPIRWDTYSPPA